MTEETSRVIAEQEATDARLAMEIARSIQEDLSRDGFKKNVLPGLLSMIGGQSGGVVRQVSGRWTHDLWVGDETTVPENLISDALDRGSTTVANGWCVTPLARSSVEHGLPLSLRSASAFVVRISPAEQNAVEESPTRRDRITQAASLLAAALQRIETRDRHERRISQLSAVLNAAAEWQRLDDDEALLHRIADTATELLNCERASIFLWDRRRRKLIGRPALGIEGGSLEVDDDAGVVGEVLRTGEPKVWSSGSDDERRVNRTVDKSLEFKTESLLAVPMQGGHRVETIGVFEAINHRSGAFDAFDAAVLADLATHAAVAIEGLRTRRSLTESRDRLVDDAASATKLVGNHPSIEAVRESAAKVAGTDLTVLVLGQNGTGKEVLAQHVHYESKRRNGPFIAVNCAALVESLLESELFGHEKGAFTDANQTRVGKFELANGGTLFLDEVGDMSPGGQAKLLRVLEEKVVVRVGGSQTIPVDVRVIAATNQPLEQLIAEKRFREDLFFRLNVVSLTLPALAHRGDDVLLLAGHFLEHFCYHIGRQVPTLESCAQQALLGHSWPGNVRELRNTMERVCYLTSEDRIKAVDLGLNNSAASRIASMSGTGLTGVDSDSSLADATRVFQVAHIDSAIAACQGNMTDAAARLGLHRSNLYRKMRQLGMTTSGE
ncbi:MAG: sigma-54-dependent Fis family transcriptional regulator [Pirellulaceae bacterium]|nr:sigma-54-dependent Fis family transcriptional regulator [Pirellulaceae bacterium]